MNSINPYVVGRYEVQWRPFVTNGWQLVAAYSEHADAETRRDAALNDWGGQVRIVTQQVIDAKGLGAQEFGPAVQRAREIRAEVEQRMDGRFSPVDRAVVEDVLVEIIAQAGAAPLPSTEPRT